MENKKLYRSERNKKIFGVCGGLGEYLNVDPVFLRIIFLVAFFTGSLGFWIYLVFALAMPKPEHSDDIEVQNSEIKRLYKSKNKVFFGVCGGLAEYFGLDTAIVRIIVGLLAIVGFGIIFYIIAAIAMPSQP